MNGNCSIVTVKPIKEVLAATPRGMVAMFTVVSVGPKVDDSVLGARVYIHNGKVYDFAADRKHDLSAENLRFLRYINVV